MLVENGISWNSTAIENKYVISLKFISPELPIYLYEIFFFWLPYQLLVVKPQNRS